MDIFCINCGSKTSYKEIKPKFCSNCGASFSDSVAKVIKKEDQVIPKNVHFIREQKVEPQVLSCIPKRLSYDGVIVTAKRPGKLGSLETLAKGNGELSPVKTIVDDNIVKQNLDSFYKVAKNNSSVIDMGGEED